MTQTEAKQVLAILKAAYPNSYRGMTKEEAIGTVNVWATQFINMPASVVMIAVNKLISTNIYPPSISEVKEKIRSLYFEAWGMLREHEQALDPEWGLGEELDEKTLATVKEIIRICEPMRTQRKIEPTLGELLGDFEKYLTGGQKQIGSR